MGREMLFAQNPIKGRTPGDNPRIPEPPNSMGAPVEPKVYQNEISLFHEALYGTEGIFIKEKKAPKRQRRPLKMNTEESPHCWAMIPEMIGPRLMPAA